MDLARRVITALVALLPALWIGAACASGPPPGHEAGQRMYREGLLASGAVLRGVLPDGSEVRGADAACAKCHGRSGLGGGDGDKSPRPIADRLFFAQAGSTAAQRARALPDGMPRRSPYTVETLARALRDGVDSSGRSLDASMPRFELGDDDAARLAAYLKHLSQARAPGVSRDEIHFATVVAPGVDPARAKAMLDVLHAFFAKRNAGTRKEGTRLVAVREPRPRTWVLHAWNLKGPPESWRGQLENRYRKQPVFALLSGIGAGEWRPVHEFCERAEVPCLFPNIDYPVISQTAYATIYFSRGMTLEAEVLAKHLADAGRGGRAGPVMQVFRDDAAGRVPALALRSALRRHGITDIADYRVTGQSPQPSFWISLLRDDHPGVLVLWLKEEDLFNLHALGDPPPGLENFYLSASLVGSPCRVLLFDSWVEKVRLIYPFELASRRAHESSRMGSWLHSRNIPLQDERVQANTYLAAAVAADALAHVDENLSRDYFIERVERVTGQSLSSALYPSLSLGPGQRFASRGSYVVRFSGDGGDNVLVPVGDWIVP